MDLSFYDFFGSIGVLLIILSYVLLQLEKLRSDQLLYSVLNAVGAGLVIISLYFDFNFSAFIVEFFWLLISLFGIGKYLLKVKSEKI
jgi:hypothetical protein